MSSIRRKSSVSVFLLGVSVVLSASFLTPSLQAQSEKKTPPLRVLIVGGGPRPDHNQVAIESNVRYVDRLLPAGTPKRILFADGDPKTQNVLCMGEDKKTFYRAPQLSTLDGASNLTSFQYNLDTLAPYDDKSNTPVLLYFTGHGSPEQKAQQDFTNNRYDMWEGEELSVQRLATQLDDLPVTEPVTLVMVQCFSGAFSNLLFKNGDPNGPLTERNICGFFASVPNRTAAGCTPEINEANYRDFTSYFFAALCGIDRLGNKVSGADYDRNGKVGMNEAYAYTLINDESIDTPVCTSDTFLRRFVKASDDEITKTPYRDLKAWATPAQKAALEGLSKYLKMEEEDRLRTAYTRFVTGTKEINAPEFVHTIRFVRLAKSVVLAHLLSSTGDKKVKDSFARLLRAESGSPLPPFTGSKEIFAPTKAS
jgi:hypothetical protein